MRKGLTLIELMVAVALVAIVATLAVTRLGSLPDRARQTAAEHDLQTLRTALVADGNGYLADMRGIPGFSVGYLRLANLLIATNLYGAVETSAYRTLACRVDDPAHPVGAGCAAPETFTRWDAAAERGWRGPYYRGTIGDFPAAEARRSAEDPTTAARGFYPDVTGLRLPTDIVRGKDGCSVYGFPGESVPLDPWGNPYVLQIPPPQAFWTEYDSNTNLPDEVRFRYARVVSAGPDGRLTTPCFSANGTNDWGVTVWNERTCRAARQAGRVDGEVNRGDDLVLFLYRNDVDEGRRTE